MSVIRPLNAGDARAVYAAVDASRRELERWMVWYRPSYALADAQTWLEACLVATDSKTAYHFAICDELRAIAGVIGIENIDPDGHRAMTGYWVGTPFTGRGLASAALRDVIEWTRSHSAIRTLWASIDQANVASRRVVENNDFALINGTVQTTSGILTYERTS